MQIIARASVVLAILGGVILTGPPRSAQAEAEQTTGTIVTSPRVTPQGKVTQLAIDPAHPGTIFAGTDTTGVYRSDNGGATWVAASRGLPAGVAIVDLTVDMVAKRQIVYAATSKGVYRTANGGQTWASQGPPTDAGTTSLALDPVMSTTLYASTGGDGIYRSADGGSTWSAIGPRLATVQVVATSPISGTTLYAGTDDGLLISTNAGSWRRGGLGHVNIQALALSASNPAIVYVGTAQGVLVSRDGGTSWTRAGLFNPAISVTTLHVDRANPAIVYAASSDGDGLWGTSDAGRHWRSLNAGLSSQNVQALAFDPTDPAIVYAGLDRGVFKSLQAGASWASSSIYDRSVRALLQPISPADPFFAGTNGGVYASSDGGTIWTSTGLGNHTVLALDRVAGSLLAATEAGVYRTTDGGHNWGSTLRFPALALATESAEPGVVWAGTSAGLFRSTDNGLSWLRTPAGPLRVEALLILGKTLYAGSAAGVLVSSTDGATFKRFDVHGESVAQLIAQPGTAGATLQIYARSDSGRIYRSNNAGAQWTDASVGVSAAATITLGNDRNLYAATSKGIYRSSSRAFSWILTSQQDLSLQPLVLQGARGAGAGTLFEGLTDQGVIARSVATTPASPFAPLPGASIGQYYAETGHFVRAPFSDWLAITQGTAILGFPRTEAVHENGMLVQYFQNAVLVYHPELADTPLVVSLEPLGQRALGSPSPRIADFDNTTTRRYFPQTGHSLSGEFLSNWRFEGGAAMFGYPIGEPVTEGNTVVQYFQNARFETDPSAGPRFFNTRLSPLGDAVAKRNGWL
jgi:photosystem II stability/assembly factor-like uncharacterized protein